MGQTIFNRFRLRRRRALFAFAFILVSLLILTGWNLTRSDEIVEARRAYSRGYFALCIGHALSHLRRQPWSREAALHVARSLSRLDYAEQAEPYFRRAGPLAPADQQIRAYGLARGPHPEHAIPLYHEILADDPENLTALRRLAAVQLAQHDTAALLELADRLGRLPNGAVIGQTLLGVVYHNDTNPQRAVACFERVIEQDPELREMPLSRQLFWSQLVEDLIACGRTDDASAVLIKALVNNPDAALLSRLGQIYFLQGRLEDAERSFRQAMEWNPSDYNPYLSLAKIALQRHQNDEALNYLNQAKLLAPDEYSVLYSLATTYQQLGRRTDAARVQETLSYLRSKSTSDVSGGKPSWPRHAL
jgi:tetratricopeptide (TPR) repeat protein